MNTWTFKDSQFETVFQLLQIALYDYDLDEKKQSVVLTSAYTYAKAALEGRYKDCNRSVSDLNT